MDGPFGIVGGSEPSYSLPPGDAHYDAGVVMITSNDSGINTVTTSYDFDADGDGVCNFEDPCPDDPEDLCKKKGSGCGCGSSSRDPAALGMGFFLFLGWRASRRLARNGG